MSAEALLGIAYFARQIIVDINFPLEAHAHWERGHTCPHRPARTGRWRVAFGATGSCHRPKGLLVPKRRQFRMVMLFTNSLIQ